MAVGHFSKEDTLILHQAVESYLAILGDDHKISVIICKLETLNNMVDLNLVVNHKGFGVEDIDVVAILAHKCKLLMQVIGISDGAFCEGDMHKLWSLLKVHHLDGKMLSGCVVNGD